LFHRNARPLWHGLLLLGVFCVLFRVFFPARVVFPRVNCTLFLGGSPTFVCALVSANGALGNLGSLDAHDAILPARFSKRSTFWKLHKEVFHRTNDVAARCTARVFAAIVRHHLFVINVSYLFVKAVRRFRRVGSRSAWYARGSASAPVVAHEADARQRKGEQKHHKRSTQRHHLIAVRRKRVFSGPSGIQTHCGWPVW
tara:strand:+ start:631 stop:1227 length:597 start_codon:yes stop_codon:yes gene_type:complete